MYLVDTNILSETSPTRDKTVLATVSDWLDAASDGLYLSVVTLAEIEDGIARAAAKGAARKAQGLCDWLETVEHLYGARVLSVSRDVARAAGRLSARARLRGAAPGFADVLIAATAEVHGLVILTRNARHFEPVDVAFRNPYESLPPLP